MKKIFTTVTVVFVLATTCCIAQRPQFDAEKFKKERSDYLTKEMGLTVQEQKAFVALESELMDKKFNLNRQLFQMRRSIRENASATAEEYRCYNQMSLDNKIEEAKLEKEYYQKFQKVVSEEKIYRYYHANAQFMRNTVKH